MTPNAPQPKVHCAICDEWTTEIWEHLRLIHPDEWEGFDKWPDGGLVMHPFVDDLTGDNDA